MVGYAFYQDVYGGSALSSEEWAFYGLRALEQLERYKKIYTVVASPEGEAMAVCAMAEALAVAKTQGVESAAIGSVSVRYGQVRPGDRERELMRCAGLYVDIYRGVSGC